MVVFQTVKRETELVVDVPTKPKPRIVTREVKQITRSEVVSKLLKHLQSKEVKSKHEDYILKCLTGEGNNKNFMGYKLEALIDTLIEMGVVKK